MPAWALEAVGWAITAIAVFGVVLNNRLDRRCFAAWLLSNTLSAAVHLACGLYALAVRDVIFFGLAVAGWRTWKARIQAETRKPDAPRCPRNDDHAED